jgi:hypothetical protein
MSDPAYSVIGLARIRSGDATYWTATFGSMTDEEGRQSRFANDLNGGSGAEPDARVDLPPPADGE